MDIDRDFFLSNRGCGKGDGDNRRHSYSLLSRNQPTIISTPDFHHPRSLLPLQQQQPFQATSTQLGVNKYNAATNQNYSIPKDGILPGGRLYHFRMTWKKMTQHSSLAFVTIVVKKNMAAVGIHRQIYYS
jgi:hypothetical protein